MIKPTDPPSAIRPRLEASPYYREQKQRLSKAQQAPAKLSLLKFSLTTLQHWVKQYKSRGLGRKTHPTHSAPPSSLAFQGMITPDNLKTVHRQLRVLKSGSTPQLGNLRFERLPDKLQSTPDFVDFIGSCRRDISLLATTPSGEKLIHSINRQTSGEVVLQPCVENTPVAESCAAVSPKKKRSNGAFDAKIHHQTRLTQWTTDPSGPNCFEGVGINSGIALGHELIHAAHYVNGEVSKKERCLAEESLVALKEEARVIGSLEAKERHLIPTENQLRKDFNQLYRFSKTGIQPRAHYDGLLLTDIKG